MYKPVLDNRGKKTKTKKQPNTGFELVYKNNSQIGTDR